MESSSRNVSLDCMVILLRLVLPSLRTNSSIHTLKREEIEGERGTEEGGREEGRRDLHREGEWPELGVID